MKRLVLAALLLFMTFPAFCGEVLIPVVYRGPGAAGTLWRTDIVVANVNFNVLAGPVPITITLHGDDGQTHEVQMPLSRLEVLDVPDAVRNWFSVENGGGIVRVTWSEADARISAHARIYNVNAQGEYGQSVPGIDTGKLATDHYLPGLTGLDGNRTNVGVSNPSDTTALVWIMMIDTAGLERGAFAVAVGPRSYRQFNDIFSHFQAGPLRSAMVRVTATNGPVYAYASIVRNDTGDATFIAQY